MIGWPAAASSASPLSVRHLTQPRLKNDTTVRVPAPAVRRHFVAPLAGSTVFCLVARSRTFRPVRATTVSTLSRSAVIHTLTCPPALPGVVPG